MPTFIDGDELVHICRHCGTPQRDRRDKPNPFLFQQYSCIGCRTKFNDLDQDTHIPFSDFLQGKVQLDP